MLKIRKLFIFLLVLGIGLYSCTADKSSKKGVTIKVAFWGSTEEIGIIKKTVDNWNKTQDKINVELLHIPTGGNSDTYVQRLLTIIAGGDAPDVVFMEVNIFIDFFDKDVLLDLSPFLKTDKEFDIKHFYPSVVKWFTRNGQIYVIPRDTAPFNCVYYNKNLFDKEGVSYPDNNWTWNDLLRIGKALTKKDQQGRYTQYGFWTWCSMNFIYSAGGGYVDDVNDPKRSLFNTPASKEGIKFYHDLVWVYKITPSPTSLELGTSEMFETGKLAMLGSGIWETPRFRKIKSFDWDIVPFPRHPKKGLMTGTGGSGYSILKYTKHPREAWEVVKCLAGKYGESVLADTGLAQPADQTIAASSHFANDGQKPFNKKILLDSVNHVSYEPFCSGWREVYSKYVSPQIDLYNRDKQSLDVTIRNIEKEVSDFLSKRKQ